MGRRHFKPEQIIHMLREAEIKLSGGKTSGEVCRELGISELKDLERENARLKKLVAEQALDKAILEEALKGKY
jgi:hypothetical protein